MTYFEKIKESVENGELLYLMSMSADKEEILNSSVDELTFIINNRVLHTSDGKPCRCYCVDCGRKGVSLKECYINIRETLLKEWKGVNMKNKFSEKYKKGDIIHFWLPDYGGYSSKIEKWCEHYNAYLTGVSLYIRETDDIFNTPEELNEFEKTHKRFSGTDCGYSFGCDFLT